MSSKIEKKDRSFLNYYGTSNNCPVAIFQIHHTNHHCSMDSVSCTFFFIEAIYYESVRIVHQYDVSDTIDRT